MLRNLLRSCSPAARTRSGVASYIIREHERGRPLSEILEDPYVRNRTTPQERERLPDRPELIRAIGDDVIASVRGSGTL